MTDKPKSGAEHFDFVGDTASGHSLRQSQQSDRMLRAILDQTFQFIGLMTTDGTLIDANETALKFSGVNKADVVNKPFWEGPWWTHSPQLQQTLREAIIQAAAGKFVRFEVTHPAADGSIHHVDFSLKPVMDDVGNVCLLIPEGRDITDHKRAEEALRAAHLQLAQSARLVSVGTLSAGIAHELNNPLTAILGLAQMMQKESDNTDKTKEEAAIIEKAAFRMKTVIDHLCAFCTESASEDWTQLNINQPIQDSLILLKTQLKDRGISVNLQLGEDLSPIPGSSRELETLFHNLITNSRDAFDSIKDDRKKEILIRSERVSGGVRITFKDNAAGMTEEVKEKIFNPFFTTKTVGKGTGLGMSVTLGILRRHEGKISIDTKLSEGTTFELFFPDLAFEQDTN